MPTLKSRVWSLEPVGRGGKTVVLKILVSIFSLPDQHPHFSQVVHMSKNFGKERCAKSLLQVVQQDRCPVLGQNSVPVAAADGIMAAILNKFMRKQISLCAQ